MLARSRHSLRSDIIHRNDTRASRGACRSEGRGLQLWFPEK
jgi:hypothetical protein